MKYDRDNYIRRSLAKLTHKPWEHYVVNRLVHRLDDPEIEFICQQHVRADGSRYLSDVYFPQFNLHLEVDEIGHANREEEDRLRTNAIEGATSHKMIRVRTFGEDTCRDRALADVDREIEELVVKLRRLKSQETNRGNFTAWSVDNQDHPERYWTRGYISVEDDVVFRTKKAALQCFGFGGESLQQGAWRVKERPGFSVWFPNFLSMGDWANRLSADGMEISEERSSGQPIGNVKRDSDFRYVFGKLDDVLGNTFFKFLGEFHLVRERSTDLRRIYARRDGRVPTISPPGEYDPHKKFRGSVDGQLSDSIVKMMADKNIKPKL